MPDTMQYAFHFDPAASFGRNETPGTFRNSRGESVFLNLNNGVDDGHQDVQILASIGHRVVRRFTQSIKLGAVGDKVEQAISAITRFRSAFESVVVAGTGSPKILDHLGRELSVEEGVRRMHQANEFDVVHIIASLLNHLPDVQIMRLWLRNARNVRTKKIRRFEYRSVTVRNSKPHRFEIQSRGRFPASKIKP